MIEVQDVGKSFRLHQQNGVEIPVVDGASFSVAPGECVALVGASGAGKSTVMRMVYGNYLTQRGRISVGGVVVSDADPRAILALRRDRLGYVSQFLRVTPRTPAIDVVAEPLWPDICDAEEARARAGEMLGRLRIPENLWTLSPTTFSGGEQQRVNLARGFVRSYPAMLLDEPTASLDRANRETVLGLIEEAKARGAALLGIFHDERARAQVCDREVDVAAFAPVTR